MKPYHRIKYNLINNIKFFLIGASGIIPNYIIFTLFRDLGDVKLLQFCIVNIPWALGILVGAFWNYILNENFNFNGDKNES